MAQAKAGELLKLIPDEILKKIGNDLEVDKANQHLTGKTIFKVLLFSLAQTTRVSLRYIENIYNSAMFQQHLDDDTNKIKGRHSSFADRLRKVKVEYFATIFHHLVETYHTQLPSKTTAHIQKFDSTIIKISGKLFDGLNCGGNNKNQLRHFKVVIGQKGLIPSSVYFCTNQSEACDDIALKTAIIKASVSSNDIITFDRGLQSGKTYIEFSQSKKKVVTRIKVDRKHQVLENYNLPEIAENDEGEIISDQKILLWDSEKNKFFNTPFRLIRISTPKQEIWILTNIFDLSAYEIAQVYRRRWDIEVFFRFIKQELNYKHFLARNQNGLMVYIYMILILAILLILYKTLNSLTGFKFVKIAFFQELENEIICDLIKISGGNPQIFLEKFGLL